MKDNIHFRTADTKDSELVSELIRESFKRQADILAIKKEEYPNYVAFETAENTQKRMTQGDSIVIAYLGDKPIGTVSFSNDSDQIHKGYIKRLAVIPEFRECGYGSLLMGYAEMKLKERNVMLVELSIVAQFEKLQSYYEGLGYVPQIRKSFSGLPFEVLFMEKTI